MKRTVLVLFLMIFAVALNAQISNPVTWIFSTKKIAGNTYELHLTASIEGNWHMYAQNAGNELQSTTIDFTPNPLLAFDGKIKEIGILQESYDKNVKAVLRYYAKAVDFVQKIKVKSAIATVVKGKISFVVCNDRVCLPAHDALFSINLGGK